VNNQQPIEALRGLSARAAELKSEPRRPHDEMRRFVAAGEQDQQRADRLRRG
jgi:hypothetical protein